SFNKSAKATKLTMATGQILKGANPSVINAPLTSAINKAMGCDKVNIFWFISRYRNWLLCIKNPASGRDFLIGSSGLAIAVTPRHSLHVIRREWSFATNALG